MNILWREGKMFPCRCKNDSEMFEKTRKNLNLLSSF